MLRLQAAFGMGMEDAQMVVEGMAQSGVEPTYCMGDDIPLAVLSDKPHMLYDYFKQRFAQVATFTHTVASFNILRISRWTAATSCGSGSGLTAHGGMVCCRETEVCAAGYALLFVPCCCRHAGPAHLAACRGAVVMCSMCCAACCFVR